MTSLPLPEKATASPRRPQEPRPEVPTAPPPSEPVRPLLDELKALPGADGSKVRSVAWRLAHHLKDVASVAFFTLVLGLIAKGSAPLQRLLDAFRVADRSRGSVRKPGAIFAATWSGWTPPPLPSAINRPAYSQTPRPPAPPSEPERGAEWSPELIARWERIAQQPGHPEARIARVMLAAYRTEATPPPPGGPAPDAATRAWTTAPSSARLDARAARVAGEGPSTDGPGRSGGGTHVR